MQQRAAKWLQALIIAASALGGAWLFVRFFLPWTAPFLVAFFFAALMEGAVRALVRRGWRRGAASGLLTTATLGALIYLFAAFTLKGVESATSLARDSGALISALGQGLRRLEGRAFEYAAAAPHEGVADYMRAAFDALGESFSAIPALASQWALDLVARAAQSTPDALLFLVTASIGTYFISAAFPRVTAFLARQLPEGLRRRAEGLGQDLRASFSGFLRAQLIMMLITFFELLFSFIIMGIRSPAAIAAITALIDALPVFGTGAVLLPWAAGCFILGNVRRALGLICCWALVSLVRSCIQAKLLGDQLGLEPLASLLAIYVGWQICGVWGMLMFPILFVTLRQLNDRGVIRLWRAE